MIDELDSFLANLDADVSKLTAKPKLEAEKKALLTTIRRTDPDRQTRIAIAGQIAEINAKIDAVAWKTIATVAMFQEQHCTYCGSVHKMFLQFMAKQSAVTGYPCTRYTRVAMLHPSLPHEVIMHRTKTTICGDCAGDFGFDFGSALVKLAKHSEPFAIAEGYVQEEEEQIDG